MQPYLEVWSEHVQLRWVHTEFRVVPKTNDWCPYKKKDKPQVFLFCLLHFLFWIAQNLSYWPDCLSSSWPDSVLYDLTLCITMIWLFDSLVYEACPHWRLILFFPGPWLWSSLWPDYGPVFGLIVYLSETWYIASLGLTLVLIRPWFWSSLQTDPSSYTATFSSSLGPENHIY